MWRRGSVGLVAAALGLLVVIVAAAVWLRAGGGPVPPQATPSGTAASSTPTSGYAPYELAEASGPQNAEQPPHMIHAPADCASLADDWLRQLCTLTLTADWRAIPIAPLSQGGQTLTGPAWWAALARAMIDGDPSFCFDGSMRIFDTLGHTGGGAPPPDTTPAPIHPVAECLAFLRSTAAKGSFSVTDRGPGVTSGASYQSGPSVTFTVAGQAVQRSTRGGRADVRPGGGLRRGDADALRPSPRGRGRSPWEPPAHRHRGRGGRSGRRLPRGRRPISASVELPAAIRRDVGRRRHRRWWRSAAPGGRGLRHRRGRRADDPGGSALPPLTRHGLAILASRTHPIRPTLSVTCP